ncbi:coiled-coil domain-containing protein 30 isoform X2 [Scophthalmus maximus]|uniref:coiled-coil domain-containing protein 30 isoform X2 n=1 Tax=Scophthalmus maximus TaxID=52904 RepID=UPI001FA8AFD3|nr:coiled-coil domain-containing protein 30 isoform X2 [Scophthalmus maximus]
MNLQTELDQISMRLQEDGLPPAASAEERQRYLWQQLLREEARRHSVTQEMQTIRTQQASEMKEVESYVAHIRGLLEERECLTADYERDNEHLRRELLQIRQQQESQTKELAEMLAQEDLGEMGLSSPSEQVAYLLVERATLLERLEAAERRLESQSLTGNSMEGHHQGQEHIHHMMGEELRQRREDMQKSMDNMTKCSSQSPWKKLFGLRRSGQSKHNITPARSEEISQEQNERQRLERDLEEASRRLAMAHQDIRRLTSELDVAKNNNLDSSGSGLQGMVQEVEHLRREVDKLKHCDMMKLQQAKEQNDRLDAENRALRERVRTIESEKQNLRGQLAINDAEKDEEDQKDKSIRIEPQNNLSALSAQEKDHIHKRCQEAMEDGLVQVRELQRQLQRLRKEQEELEERNEELEALLGEAQNASKEESHRHEGELEGLHRRIKSLEAELKRQDAHEKIMRNGDEVKATESFLQLHLRDGSQERLALLEARLTEEKDWRKQLEVDLSAAQAALKKDKEALQIGERELKKLRLEVNSLQTECQQGKTLIKSLTQVKGEKAVLEEKVAQMERAHSRLQSELERYKDGNGNGNRTKEDLKESRLQVDQLQEQADRLTAELSSLQTTHNTLRDEMVSERSQTSELQAKLSASVHERLAAEGERERLELEIQRLNEQLKWHHEQLASTKEALGSSQKLELHDPPIESRLSPVEKTNDESLDQLSCLKQEVNHMQRALGEERLVASQHQLALQAQVNEAQAHIRCQNSVLSQKAEEAKQMRQDLQRAQSLFTSAERELRYEKERNMDLKRHNTLLDQEKLKLCAELKQVQTKLVQAEQTVHSQAAEGERQQQKTRELELELARSSTNRSAATSLQEDLQAERVQLITADKKVLELQQQLKNAQHQLRVEEARAGETSRLERDSRDLSDTLSALRAQQHEEHITRKLLEQREEELQQQVRSLRLKEASLTRTNTELSHRAQQLETRLTILEAELSKAREEVREGQRSSHRLQEELAASQQECDRLPGELQQVLLQLDTHVRKYNEKHSQHKTKLRQAKQVFLKAMAQRDRTIQKLENDLVLASSLLHKEKERIDTVLEENEKLLEERRELLRKISEAEEMGSNGMRTASTVQHRVNVLEVENRQLQDRTLKLSNQVSSLERALRNTQSFYSLENAKKVLPSESLCDSILHASTLSLTSGSCDPLEILDKLCRVKVGERAVEEGVRASVSAHQLSEQGYLNLTSPLVSPEAKATEESSNNSDMV